MANRGSLFDRLKKISPKMDERIIRRLGAYDFAKDTGMPYKQLEDEYWDAIRSRNKLRANTVANMNGERLIGFTEEGYPRWSAPNAQSLNGPQQPKVYFDVYDALKDAGKVTGVPYVPRSENIKYNKALKKNGLYIDSL